MRGKPEPIHTEHCIVGESPVWDARAGCLYFVDIRGKAFFRMDGLGGKTESCALPQQIGCLALCEDGGLLLGMEDGVYRRQGGTITPAHAPVTVKGRRFNDGKVGPDGLYYVGTTDDAGRGAFCRLGGGRLDELFGGCRCSNGLDWSADQTRLYYTDSLLHRVEIFDFDGETHTVSGRRTLTPIAEDFGLPDGMAIDAEDNLWLAVWGGHCVVRIDGRTGKLLDRIDLPASQVSSCCFAGEGLDRLVITTAAYNVDLAAEPAAGYTFCVPVDVPGRPFRYYRRQWKEDAR